MKGIAFCALQPVSAKATVVFHMPDYRFDGAASPNIAFQPRGNAAPEFAVIDLDPSRDSLFGNRLADNIVAADRAM